MRLEQDLCIGVGRFWREILMWTWGRIFILKWTTLKLLGVVLFDIKPMADLPSSHLTIFSILHFEWSMLGRSIVFCVTLFPQWTDFLKVQWYATKPTGAVNRQLLLRYIPKMIVEYTPPPPHPRMYELVKTRTTSLQLAPEYAERCRWWHGLQRLNAHWRLKDLGRGKGIES